MNDPEAQPAAELIPSEAPEPHSGASLASAGSPVAAQPPRPPHVHEPLPALPAVRSDDGRVELTEAVLAVRGQAFSLLELERVEVAPVRWLLWYLLGGLGLAVVMIAFLQNWLRTGPAMLGMALAALLLAYGHRGTNRLRLHRLGREAVNFALPGEPAPWQRLAAEINRRIYRAHDRAACETAALLAQAEAEAAAEAAQQAHEAAQAAATAVDPAGDE